MKRHLRTAVYAAALLLGSVSVDAILSSASAQADVSVSFDSFHNQLAQYGDWVYSDRWGEVWVPGDVSDDFHPYGTRGHWVNTDEYGWTWVSGYEWGDIPFHYGRWVNDPDDGWMWIPGYIWSPGWVVWRNNGQYTGWMPMPPDDEFLGRGPSTSIGVSIGGLSVQFNNTDDNYGYSRWYGRDYSQDRFASNWVFIGTGHIGETDYGRYQAPRSNYTTLIRDSHNITNYTVVNNYVVNRSVDPRAVQQAGGHVQTVHASVVIKRPQFVARADTGSQIQARMRIERPRGTGLAGSAPKPTAVQIQSLSTKAPPMHGGKPPAHLFTRDTVTKAPLSASPATASGPAGAMSGPKAGATGMPPSTMSSPMGTGKNEHGPKPGVTETPATTPSTTPAGNETGKHEHGDRHGGTMESPATPATNSMSKPTGTETGNPEHGPKHGGAMETPTTSPAATPTTTPATNATAVPTGNETGKHEHGTRHGGAMESPSGTPATNSTSTPAGAETGTPEHTPRHGGSMETTTHAPSMTGPAETPHTVTPPTTHAVTPPVERTAHPVEVKPAPSEEKAKPKKPKPDETETPH